MSHNSLINHSGHPESRMHVHFVASGCGVLQRVAMVGGGFMPYLKSACADPALPEGQEKATVRNCPAAQGDSAFLY